MKRYRLIDEDKLRKLIESDMIYNELEAAGVDNWIGCDFIHYPNIDDIEKELNKYKESEI